MKLHTKKLIAPVIVTMIVLAFLGAYSVFCVLMDIPVAIKAAGIIILLALAGVSIYVLNERIKEIRSGEEDGISKY